MQLRAQIRSEFNGIEDGRVLIEGTFDLADKHGWPERHDLTRSAALHGSAASMRLVALHLLLQMDKADDFTNQERRSLAHLYADLASDPTAGDVLTQCARTYGFLGRDAPRSGFGGRESFIAQKQRILTVSLGPRGLSSVGVHRLFRFTRHWQE